MCPCSFEIAFVFLGPCCLWPVTALLRARPCWRPASQPSAVKPKASTALRSPLARWRPPALAWCSGFNWRAEVARGAQGQTSRQVRVRHCTPVEIDSNRLVPSFARADSTSATRRSGALPVLCPRPPCRRRRATRVHPLRLRTAAAVADQTVDVTTTRHAPSRRALGLKRCQNLNRRWHGTTHRDPNNCAAPAAAILPAPLAAHPNTKWQRYQRRQLPSCCRRAPPPARQ